MFDEMKKTMDKESREIRKTTYEQIKNTKKEIIKMI